MCQWKTIFIVCNSAVSTEYHVSFLGIRKLPSQHLPAQNVLKFSMSESPHS